MPAKRHVGICGAFAYSAANFFLAFMLQATVNIAEFGFFAFSLILVQFGTALSNALFGSPILVRLAERGVDRAAIVQSFALANFLFIALGSLVLCCILLALGMPAALVGLVSLHAAALWLRWFFRAVELASHKFVWAAAADVAYGIVALLAGVLFFLWFGVEVFWALLAMLIGTLASMAAIGKGTLGHFFARGMPSLAPFLGSFRQHGSWASVGVVTTEITSNLHAYVLTLWLGPAAFAPVATLALFLRPIPILMQAVTQFERPRLARHITDGATGALVAGVRTISKIMLGGVLLNTVLVASILLFAGWMIGGGAYEAQTLWPLLVLLSLSQLVRGLRTGPSAALQAAGRFRPLAMITVNASLVTMAGSLIALVVGWQVVPMVLVGVLIGEVVTNYLVRGTAKSLILSVLAKDVR